MEQSFAYLVRALQAPMAAGSAAAAFRALCLRCSPETSASLLPGLLPAVTACLQTTGQALVAKCAQVMWSSGKVTNSFCLPLYFSQQWTNPYDANKLLCLHVKAVTRRLGSRRARLLKVWQA